MEKDNISNLKVAIIGAGPAGMSHMCAFAEAQKKGETIPKITCFEKQEKAGGLWNYTWRTGLDQFGEAVHSSMYHQLFSNAPKEVEELPHYTYMDHFKKPVGSYPPRESIHGYLMGRFDQYPVCKEWLKTSTCVKRISFDESTKKFTVIYKAMTKEHTEGSEEFDKVIVSTGYFHDPNMPAVEGFENFNGRLMHSHDVRNGQDYFGQRVCVVGTSYSAEDIASMAWKNGCKSVIACSRGTAMCYEFPDKFSKKPMIKNCNEKTLTFEDGTTAEADVIIMCTGYTHNVPFMEDKLRLNTDTSLYIDKAYKAMFWQTNPNLMYTGMLNQCYTFTMFDS
jgi:trimethylamine monooxygenase